MMYFEIGFQKTNAKMRSSLATAFMPLDKSNSTTGFSPK